MIDDSVTQELALREAMDDVARQRGLGPVVAEARLPLKQRVRDNGPAWAAAAVLVLGLLAMMVIGASSQAGHLAALVVVLASLGYLVVRPFRRRAARSRKSGAETTPFKGVRIVQALEGGAIWGTRKAQGGQEMRVFTWPEVTRVRRMRLETRSTAGVLSRTTVDHALQVDQEGQPPMSIRWAEPSITPELTRVALAIEDRHTAYVVAAALDALRAGQTYSFGPAQVGPDGVTMRGELTPWSQLADVRSSMPYVYSGTATSEVFLVRHDRKRTRSVQHAELTSARAFFEVAERVTTTPR